MAEWDLKNQDQMRICTVIFASDAGISLIIMLSIWFATAARFNQCRKRGKNARGGAEYSSLAMNVLRGRVGKGNTDGVDGTRLLESGNDSEEELFGAKTP